MATAPKTTTIEASRRHNTSIYIPATIDPRPDLVDLYFASARLAVFTTWYTLTHIA